MRLGEFSDNWAVVVERLICRWGHRRCGRQIHLEPQEVGPALRSENGTRLDAGGRQGDHIASACRHLEGSRADRLGNRPWSTECLLLDEHRSSAREADVLPLNYIRKSGGYASLWPAWHKSETGRIASCRGAVGEYILSSSNNLFSRQSAVDTNFVGTARIRKLSLPGIQPSQPSKCARNRAVHSASPPSLTLSSRRRKSV